MIILGCVCLKSFNLCPKIDMGRSSRAAYMIGSLDFHFGASKSSTVSVGLTQAGQMKPEAAVLSHEAKNVLVDYLFYLDPSTNWEANF